MDDEVLAANQAFYDAFRDEDYVAMEVLWARRAPVACVHPGWPALVGRAPVMESWRGILSSGAPAIRAESPRVMQVTEDVAYVLCVEVVSEGKLAATNVFVKEEGEWKMAHHHAGPMTGELEGEEEPSEPSGPLN
jgi:ketosteroid isomerase-like protein